MESVATQTLHITLTVHGQPLSLDCTVPAGDASSRQLLPMARSLSDELVRRSVDATEATGRSVSCKAHCGACCRQLIPTSPVEAHAILALVEAMPEARRATLLNRFAVTREALSNAGLSGALMNPEQFDGTVRELGLRYFKLRLGCPFLEDELCSIYEHRPVACREYLVTSPAENCSAPTAESIDAVPMAAKVSHALMGIDVDAEAERKKFVEWAPLSLLVDWCASHPPGSSTMSGKALLQKFFELLLQKKMER